MEKPLWDTAFSRWRKTSENMSVSQITMDYLDFQVQLEESIIRLRKWMNLNTVLITFEYIERRYLT